MSGMLTLTLTDELRNSQGLLQQDIEASFGTTTTRVENLATVFDSTAPQVTAFELTPNQVNTDTASQTITLTITVTDDMTGVYVAGTQLKLAPLIGTQSIQFWNLTRVSGDELNGVYTDTATLPQGSKVGVWVIDPLTLTDQIGNSRGLIAEDMIELFPESENLTVANTAQAESVIIEKQ